MMQNERAGRRVSAEVTRFCEEVFAGGGAILSGPGGGRYVYDLRKQFDLFLKLSPLRIANGLLDVARVRPESLSGTDIVIARENTGGVYQGTWRRGELGPVGPGGRAPRRVFGIPGAPLPGVCGKAGKSASR